MLEFREALNAAAVGLAEGVEKYGRGNWRRGLPEHEIMDSLVNHLTAHLAGEIVDPDSKTGATHLAKVLCNALMLVELHNRPAAPRLQEASLEEAFNFPTAVIPPRHR